MIRANQDLSIGTQIFFNLSYDPFIRDALPYNKLETLLVKTKSIKFANDILARFDTDPIGKSIILRGHRGSGKSTLLRYMHKRLEQATKFSLYCNITFADPKTSSDIKLTTHEQILHILLDRISQETVLDQKVDLGFATKAIDSHSVFEIEHAIHRLLEIVAPFYGRFFIMVDDLDKLGYEKWPLLTQYFIENQGFYQRLRTSEKPTVAYSSYVIVSLQPYQLVTPFESKQIGYFGDTELMLKRWSLEEVTKMIEKRLRDASTRRDFQLSHFFDRDVIRRIYQENDANPRFIGIACKLLLQKAGAEKIKPIKTNFIKRYPELIKGARHSLVFSDFELVHKSLEKNFTKIYIALKRTFADEETKPEISQEHLWKLWSEGKDLDVPQYNALVKNGIARRTVDRDGQKIVMLEKAIQRYFQELLKQLAHDQEGLRLYIMNMFM